MDARFEPAVAAIRAGNLQGLRNLLRDDPGLATAQSTQSHPTLLACLVLETGGVPNHLEMAWELIGAGAEIQGPLIAAASVDNAAAAAVLLDAGASVNGRGGWSPLEEALYWSNQRMIDLLLSRGASLHNLRLAAALGRTDLIEEYFDADGKLKAEAGGINWPFGDPRASNLPGPIKSQLIANVDGWDRTPEGVLNNAMVYACMHNRIGAADLLLEKGAQINAIPPGFDFAGTGLHYAALNGHRKLVDFLLSRGANPSILDTKVRATPAGWAAHGGHPELARHLELHQETRA